MVVQHMIIIMVHEDVAQEIACDIAFAIEG
jgi:hypothetical protein